MTALVIGIDDPFGQRAAKPHERLLRFGLIRPRKVMQLPGITLHVKELLLRHGRLYGESLIRGELAPRFQTRPKGPDGIFPRLVLAEREERHPRRVIANVTPAPVSHGANAHHGHVAAVAMAEDVVMIRLTAVAKEDAALHLRRLCRPGDVDHGRSKIN